MTVAQVIGDKLVMLRLSLLKNSMQRRIVKRAVGKGLRVITKAIKGEIPSDWKQLKPFIGSRLAKKTGAAGQLTTGKAGVGVGKKGKAAKDRTGRAGVGIGAANVHWFILGTKQRRTGVIRKGRGAKAKTVATGGKIRRTGAMPPQVGRPVRTAVAKSYRNAEAAMAAEIRIGIERELAKVKK